MAQPPGRPPGRPPMGVKSIGRAVGYLRRYKLDATGVFLSMVLLSAANLASPALVLYAIDSGLGPRDRWVVLKAVGGLVAVALGRGLFNFLQGYLGERASQGVAYDLREALFTRIQRLSFSYYDQA